MNCIIPFEKRLKFEGNVKEIVSISLEHEITQNSDEVLGNFIISGTYKEHELSVNTEDFKFVVPFAVDLEKPVQKDTFEFWIDNFTYDINDNEMIVKIDYGMTAEEVKEEKNEEVREEPTDLIVTPEIDGEEHEEPLNEERESVIVNDTTEIKTSDAIANLETEDDYMTFKIHVVKEEETLESICQSNNIIKDDLLKLNDINDINIGDKLIIPYHNE